MSHPEVTLEDLDSIEKLNLQLSQLHQKWQTIFMWQDGPLVQAMKNGDLLLVDEISLADDSVLERLNSVLEPERKLVGNFSSRSGFLTCFGGLMSISYLLELASGPFLILVICFYLCD